MTPEIPWSPRAQDLSQRQRTEDLFQAKLASDAVNKAKLEQLQFLCHEIRNPLNGILGNVSFMLETEIDEEQALLVAGTYDRARQLREVVDDVRCSSCTAPMFTLEMSSTSSTTSRSCRALS